MPKRFPTYDVSYRFPTDRNGEPYFISEDGYRVYPKRKSGHHNIGGEMVEPTDFTIKRLGQPDPNRVISRKHADKLLGMTNDQHRGWKKGKKYEEKRAERIAQRDGQASSSRDSNRNRSYGSSDEESEGGRKKRR